MSHSLHTTPEARKRLRRRYAAETRFRAIGLCSLLIAFGFLLFFLVTIVKQAMPAFFQNYLTLQVELPANDVANADFDGILKKSVYDLFSLGETSYKRSLWKLVSSGAPVLLRRDALKHPEWAGRTITYEVPLDDNADLYLKGRFGALQALPVAGTLDIGTNGEADVLTTTPPGGFTGQSAQGLNTGTPSYFVKTKETIFKLTGLWEDTATGYNIILPIETKTFQPGEWQLLTYAIPETERKLGDDSIILIEMLKERGLTQKSISREFFTLGASREAEMAGIWSALIGSILTLCVTLLISFPISVAAAIYLEEFAPKTRFTELIEVNINNLAAVPSIIFGLMGLAVFLNVFGMPRSAPVVGGLVLALMTLPIIIIASRAALRAVSPSVKEAALGLGASHTQAVFHHVLPLAVPGILTGTILGTARALGETAPLLLIGMVAFVVEPPRGFLDAATLLPVQIFMWNDFPEIGFQQKTAAAILVMLLFLAVMNLAAVILRRRFERRW